MNLDKVIKVRNNKTIYLDGDKCIKIFNADCHKSDVFNEALNQARIEETGLNIPRVLEVTVIDGRWAIISEYVKGKSLSELMAQEPEKKSEYLELLVRLQMSVHEKTSPLLNKLRDKLDRKIADSDFDATVRYSLHTRIESMPRHNKVCHGDFIPSNVIIAEDGTPYILDWSHATQGNAAADVARTYLLFCVDGDADTAKEYLEIYCKNSGVEKQYVEKWLPIVAAANSIEGDDKEREMLSGFVGVNK